jgi:hypothetical protein
MKMAYSTLKLGAIGGVCPRQAPESALRAEETLIIAVFRRAPRRFSSLSELDWPKRIDRSGSERLLRINNPILPAETAITERVERSLCFHRLL